jgi:hypothetical protein
MCYYETLTNLQYTIVGQHVFFVMGVSNIFLIYTSQPKKRYRGLMLNNFYIEKEK